MTNSLAILHGFNDWSNFSVSTDNKDKQNVIVLCCKLIRIKLSSCDIKYTIELIHGVSFHKSQLTYDQY